MNRVIRIIGGGPAGMSSALRICDVKVVLDKSFRYS